MPNKHTIGLEEPTHYCCECSAVQCGNKYVVSLLEPTNECRKCDNGCWEVVLHSTVINHDTNTTKEYLVRKCHGCDTLCDADKEFLGREDVSVSPCVRCDRYGEQLHILGERRWLFCPSCNWGHNEDESTIGEWKPSVGEEKCLVCSGAEWQECTNPKRILTLNGKKWPHLECKKCSIMYSGHFDLYTKRCMKLERCVYCDEGLGTYLGGYPITFRPQNPGVCRKCGIVWAEQGWVVGTNKTQCKKCNIIGIMPLTRVGASKLGKDRKFYTHICFKCCTVLDTDLEILDKFGLSVPTLTKRECRRCHKHALLPAVRVRYSLDGWLQCFECGVYEDLAGKQTLDMQDKCKCSSDYTTCEVERNKDTPLLIRVCVGCQNTHPEDKLLLLQVSSVRAAPEDYRLILDKLRNELNVERTKRMALEEKLRKFEKLTPPL